MLNLQRKKKGNGLITAGFLVWLVMNIRVAIGIATPLERALDGLVGIVLLFGAVFLGLNFFGMLGKNKD